MNVAFCAGHSQPAQTYKRGRFHPLLHLLHCYAAYLASPIASPINSQSAHRGAAVERTSYIDIGLACQDWSAKLME